MPKIIKAEFSPGLARFVVDDFIGYTFEIPLKDLQTKQQIKDELREAIEKLKIDTGEEKFKALEIANMVGDKL